MTGRRRPSSPRQRVLLLGEDTRIVLPVVRSLGRAGVEVHLAWCPAPEPVRRSRHLARAHELAAWDGAPHEVVPPLRDLADRIGFDLVLPVTEAATYTLHHARPHLPPTLPVHLLGERAFEVCFDKARTHEVASQVGLDVPRSRIVVAGEFDAAEVADWHFPLALKPLCSVDAANPKAKQFVRRLDDRSALDRYLGRAAAGETVMLQEWFAGEGVGVEFLADRGQPLRFFQHRRLHETIGFGSTYRESTPVDPHLREGVTRLLKAIDYTGVGMAEFRRDPRSGRAVLLEVNARFWGSLPLAVAAGADFPRNLVELLIDGRRDFPQEYRVGVRCRDFLNDARWTWRCLRGKRGRGMEGPAFDGWEMNPLPRRTCMRHLLRGLMLRDHVDTFAADDPRPFAAELTRVARTLLARG